MNGSRRNEKRIETKPDPRQRPLFDGWIATACAERETSTGDPRRADPPGDRET